MHANIILVELDLSQAAAVADKLLASTKGKPFWQSTDDYSPLPQECLLFKTKGDGECFGFATLRLGEEFVELYRLFVAPDFRKRRLGTEMFETVCSWLRSREYTEVWIEASNDVLDFWERASKGRTVRSAGIGKWCIEL